MILDATDNLKRYAGLFREGCLSAIIKELPALMTAADGTEIKGAESGCLARVLRLSTKEREACTFETHHEHTDIQIIIEGAEEIDWAPIPTAIPSADYDQVKDLQWHPGLRSVSTFPAKAGMSFIFFPNDAHRPQVIFGEADFVRKVVIKVPNRFLR